MAKKRSKKTPKDHIADWEREMKDPNSETYKRFIKARDEYLNDPGIIAMRRAARESQQITAEDLAVTINYID